jgi:CubicO group peptidase (beta-lactamase class C family)
LPQYERAITIRMLLDHTSGLRDWGDIASLAGAPRGTRAYTHAHVLEIIARQRAVNYPPGDKYSYTNSGYNLLAMLVARVSGQSFADFTRDRLFRPLGMTSTSWRDDYRRIVPGRALAYAPVPGALASWRTDMPNEDAHGNGGLLTTVGDLLKWNDALTKRTVGGAQGGALVDSLTRRGVLTSGERLTYAAGLVVDEYRGAPRIGHSGATAGYRSYLVRFLTQRDLSVAVLCNTYASAAALALGMVDGLATGLAPIVRGTVNPPAPRGTPVPIDSLRVFVGEYVSDEVGASLRVTLEGERLMVRRGAESPASATQMGGGRFSVGGTTVWFTPDASSGGVLMHVATGRAHDVVFRRVR